MSMWGDVYAEYAYEIEPPSRHAHPVSGMTDCVHLKACRRIQKIGKQEGCSFARHCDARCTAYERVESVWAVSLGAAKRAVEEVACGESDDDVLPELTHESETLFRLVPGERNDMRREEAE